MPDSLDSSPSASEEGGSSCLTEESYYVPSPADTVILDPELQHDIATVTAMSCLTTRATRRKAPRDLNNRWVLLNKDTFQEILNATLNQMTAPGMEPASPGAGDTARTESAKGQSLAPGSPKSPLTAQHSAKDLTMTTLGTKSSDTAKKGAHSKDRRRPLASHHNRTIIASSAFKKQELHVVSRLGLHSRESVVTKKVSPLDKKPSASKSSSSPSRVSSGVATAQQRKHSSTSTSSGSTRTTTTTTTGSRRSKVVCKAPNKAVPGEPGGRGGRVDIALNRASGAHDSLTAAATALPTTTAATASTAHRLPVAAEKEAKDEKQVASSVAHTLSDNMSVAAVAGSPSTAVTGTSSPGTSSAATPVQAAKMKVPVAQERWVKVSKSTLFDLVEELVARRLGEDSPATSDGQADDKTQRSDTDCDNNNSSGSTPAANNGSAPSTSKHTLSDTGNGTNTKDTSGNTTTGTKNIVSNSNDNSQNTDVPSSAAVAASPDKERWVALNKTVVNNLVDEAIMRQLGEDKEEEESRKAGESGSDIDGKRELASGPDQQGAGSGRADGNAQLAALSDGSRPSGSTLQCPQATRAGSPPTNTRPTQLTKPISGASRLDGGMDDPGQVQGRNAKKRGAECAKESEHREGSLTGSSKRKRSDSGQCSLSARLSETAAAAVVVPTPADVQKALCMAAAAGDPLLTASLLSASQTAGNVAALRNLFVPCDPSLRFASSGERVGIRSGQPPEPVSPGVDSRHCSSIIDLRARTLPGDATTAEISLLPRRPTANQSVPTDFSHNDATAIKLDGRNISDRCKGASETVTSNKRDTKNARDSPETTWVAVSKSDVNSIVDCVVNTMINDDDTVTSPARTDDSSMHSVSPRSTSSTTSSHEVFEREHDYNEASAENVPPSGNINSRSICAQVLANRQVGSDLAGNPGSENDLHQSRTVAASGQRSQSLAHDNWCNRTENVPNKPTSRSTSPSSNAKENAYDYIDDREDESSLSDEVGEEGDGEEPRKAVKWKSALMKRLYEENGSPGKTGGRASPGVPPSRGRSASDPGSKPGGATNKDGSPAAKQDRRCSKRVSTSSGKRRTNRAVLTAK